MRNALILLGITALATANPAPVPGGVTSSVAPSSTAPAGCSPNYDGTFELAPVNISASSRRSLRTRDTQLGITLKNGILTDEKGRTGYVASNQQFQFDDPPQAGAIYTAGFAICPNSSLVLGNDAVWYECQSGNFYNIYLQSQGGQCSPVILDTTPAGSGSGTPAPVPASTTYTTISTSATASANSSTTIVPSNSTTVVVTTMSGTMSNSSAAGSTTTSIVGHKSKHTGVGVMTNSAGKTTKSMGATASSAPAASSASSAAVASASGGAASAVRIGHEIFAAAVGFVGFALL